jgi:glyoxylase-like metal-dependent hydrolase (beta-lactamase superfamily II)
VGSGAALIVAALGLPTGAAAQDFSKVEIKVVPVRGNLHMLSGGGGNVGVCAGADGVFMIDDKYAPLTDKIKAAVATVSDRPIRFVINTHLHGDHTGGNENFAAAGAVVVAHANVRKRMSAIQLSATLKDTIPAAPPGALPIVTFESDVVFHVNGDEIRVTHMPHAHTDGDAIVIFRTADAIHMGDLFFNGFYPRIDVASGGSIDGMVAGADKVLAMLKDSTIVIPGHGPLGDRAALKAYRDMLAGVRDQAKATIKGKTREQFIAAKPTAEWDAKWGGGFMKPDAFAGGLYDDLSRGTKGR